MSRNAWAAITGLVLAVVVAAPSGAAASRPGAIGLRLLDAPADASNDPRAHLYIVDHLAPGTSIERRIEVQNTTASAARIALYPAAATIAKGAFLGAAGHSPNELSTWTSVRLEMLDIAAGERAVATVNITVPDDAAPGERYGVIWAETRSAPSDRGITQVNRVGIRMYLSIGSGGAPAADFEIESLTPMRSPDGQPMVVATVHNTGGRALDMNGTLKLLDGPGGLSAGPFAATLGTTLGIGETESVEIVLDERMPAGPWDARLMLRSGLLERSVKATISFPGTGASQPVDASPDGPASLYLSIVGAIAALLTLLAIAVMFVRSRVSSWIVGRTIPFPTPRARTSTS